MAPPRPLENYQPHQPITTALRQICEAYASNTCLRELLQNADDAEATEMEYVLDTNTYESENLLDPGLAEYHGPALLAKNNSVFRKEDFTSLSSIGDSCKRDDPASTGKFGQGFSSLWVYHWTDSPWVLSRERLLFLDPHMDWSNEWRTRGGPTWDVVTQDCPEIRNHMRTFKSLNLEPGHALDATIIRLPLRTAAQAMKSKIVGKEASISDIRQALLDFSKCIEEGGLVFLKHIKKVTVRVDENILLTAHIVEENSHGMAIRQSIPSEFRRLYNENTSAILERICPTFKTTFCYRSPEKDWTDTYLLQHCLAPSTGDSSLDAWARASKLYPWVAVAARLNQENGPLQGSLFSVLSLNEPTHQPVHIHGLFSISPDRARLRSDGRPFEWNTYLFKNCVSDAWAKLLVHRRRISYHTEDFLLWPNTGITHKASNPWTMLDDWVLDLILSQQASVWNAVNGTCVSHDKAVFTVADADSCHYRPAWAEIGLPAIVLHKALFKKVKERSTCLSEELHFVTSKMVREFLRDNQVTPADTAALVLEYCLLDAIGSGPNSVRDIGNELHGIRFWPTLNGKLIQSTHCSLLLPRDGDESRLFRSSRGSDTVDPKKLTPKVREFLRNYITDLGGVARFRAMPDLAIDWPNIYHCITEACDKHGCSPRNAHEDPLLRQVWIWICVRLREEKSSCFPDAVYNLRLLPTHGGLSRTLRPNQHVAPALIVPPGIVQTQWLIELMHSKPPLIPPVVDTETLPTEASQLLQEQALSKPGLRLACLDHLDSFVEWLMTARLPLSSVSNRYKRQLLGHLEQLIRNRKNDDMLDTLRAQARYLPLFSKSVSTASLESRAVMMCALDQDKNSYKMPHNLPPLPDLPGVSFYDASSPAEEYVLKTLELLGHAKDEDIISQFLVPWMESIYDNETDVSLLTAKEGLADWIFGIAPSWRLRVLANHRVVPLPSQDKNKPYRSIKELVAPDSQYAQLYFPEENVFPCPNFYMTHKVAFQECGIGNFADPVTVSIDRARVYCVRSPSDSLLQKLECLLQIPLPSDLSIMEETLTEIRSIAWLPVITNAGDRKMVAPNQCRAEDQAGLVDKVWGVLTLSVAAGWKRFLGWDMDIPRDVLFSQLDQCISLKEMEKVEKVLENLKADSGSHLADKPCILGSHGDYFIPSKVFLPGTKLRDYPLDPYIDELDLAFALKHPRLIAGLGLRPDPSLEDLQDVQAALGDKPLNEAHLNIAIRTLEVAVRLGHDVKDLRVPCTKSTLRPYFDVVNGAGDNAGSKLDYDAPHHMMSPELVRCLGLEDTNTRAIQEAMEVEDGYEYSPQQSYTTNIHDTLERYPMESTFNEFLANADDAGARTLIWTLDKCLTGPFATQALLTTNMKPFQGPALIAYNDRVFLEKDWKGFKDLGRGGKDNDATTTGTFGLGAMSMYHFTDVPMIVSGNSYLILDPRQEVLPAKKRSKERVPGLKLSLSALNRLGRDQLAPCVGLHGLATAHDTFQGTIFRLPLRTHDARTGLRDDSHSIDSSKVETLLREYQATARSALLFLRHVQHIEFRIRGQDVAEWKVSILRRQGSSDSICRELLVTSNSRNTAEETDVWIQCLKQIDDVPSEIKRRGRSSKKNPECGVAALISRRQEEVTQDRNGMMGPRRRVNYADTSSVSAQSKIFCRLPITMETSLPVSIHGSFAITGDRKSIEYNCTSEHAPWNDWLLTNSIPMLYLDLLQYLAPRLGANVFTYWPSIEPTLPSDLSLSCLVCDSFWSRLKEENLKHRKILPLCSPEQQKNDLMATTIYYDTNSTYAVVSLEKAMLSLLPATDFDKLRVLLIRFYPYLVQIPTKLRKFFAESFPGENVSKVDSTAFCTSFKVDSNCRMLELELARLDLKEREVLMKTLLDYTIPKLHCDDFTPLERLEGCRILPRPGLESPLGLLTRQNLATADFHLVASSQEQDVFSFAVDRMVNTRLFGGQSPNDTKAPRNPIGEIAKAGFNIRELEVKDIGNLLRHEYCPLGSPSRSRDLEAWLPRLWSYLNASLICYQAKDIVQQSTEAAQAFLSLADVKQLPLYRGSGNIVGPTSFVSPNEFDLGPFIVQPNIETQTALCAEIPGLIMLDGECVPSVLAEKEGDLRMAQPFNRLLQALERIEPAKSVPKDSLLDKALSSKAREELRSLTACALESPNELQKSMLRSFPVWPRMQKYNSIPPTSYICARDAYFCEEPWLLQSWVSNLHQYGDPQHVRNSKLLLARMGVTPLSSCAVWELIKGDLPVRLSSKELRRKHIDFIKNFADQGMGPHHRLAPNGESTMCYASELYDHTEPIFKSAFRDCSLHFVHPEMQVQECLSSWIYLGLQTRSNSHELSYTQFLKCALAISDRWKEGNQDEFFAADAEVVTMYLTTPRTSLQHWPLDVWQRLSELPIFQIREVAINEPQYRQGEMTRKAGISTHCALRDSADLCDLRNTWSQAVFLKNPLAPMVYKFLPNDEYHSLTTVYHHLQYLISITETISQDELAEYLRDVQACYSQLQSVARLVKEITGITGANLWLNLDTTQIENVSKDQLEGNIRSADVLCLNASHDTEKMIVIRKFLVPYEKLLNALGCPAFVQPDPLPPRAAPEDTGFSLGLEINNLRQRGELIDVVFEVDGVTMSAHKNVLVVASDFCKALFTGEWGKTSELRVPFEYGSKRTLSAMLDFAYGIDFVGPELENPGDVKEIADRLDEMLELLRAADSWQMLRLRDQVEDFLTDTANATIYRCADNVDSIRDIAAQANAARLVTDCNNYIQRNAEGLDRMKQT